MKYKNTSTRELPKKVDRIRDNVIVLTVFLVLILAGSLGLLFVAVGIQDRSLAIRQDVRDINALVVRLSSFEQAGEYNQEYYRFIDEIRDFQCSAIRGFSNPLETMGIPTFEQARTALRTWATALNDQLYSRNQQGILAAVIILIFLGGMTIILWMRIQGEYRDQIRFLGRLKGSLESLKNAAQFKEFKNGSIAPLKDQPKPVWAEERLLDDGVGRIFQEMELNSSLIDSGYNAKNLDELLESLQVAIAQWVPCGRLALAFVDTSGSIVAENAVSILGPPLLNAGFTQSLQETSLSELVTTQKPRIINDLIQRQEEFPSPATELIIQEGYRSSLTLPLVFNSRCVGFVFINADKPGAYTQEHVALVQRFFVIIKNYVYHHYIVQLILAQTAGAFVRTMEKKDDETSAHIIRMSNYSHVLAKGLNEHTRRGTIKTGYEVTQRKVREIFWFAPLHDLGKIGIPDAVLFKQGGFTPEERRIMETHVPMGTAILQELNTNLGQYLSQHFLTTAVEIIETHHERWDGSGYPNKLKESAIPLAGRIVAIADVFDALTSERPYKDAWPLEKAYQFIESQKGLHFDPFLVDQFLENRPAIEEIYYQHRG
ncbi:HD domain-containing phosphohydrolase [Spirochaeta lutea]|uniref:HD-GYP domain-containing protein n=1 Tax=Spirochaeta lutea TaxID=1480694 RepID=A0A098R328_9SPIO|nr:HD domain-containing phosphohydrolase [Spirochaeta lutea]KGE73142.1 hypothetical protein DC28_04990 [Spirochaeta lutea]